MEFYEHGICELMWNLSNISVSESFSNDKLDLFEHKLSNILYQLKKDLSESSNDEYQYNMYRDYLCLLFCMIGYVRDIVDGCGERDLSYRMIHVWYSYYPVLSLYALHCFFLGSSPYGSWKDLKYFCRLISLISRSGRSHPLISSAIQIANQQLWDDYCVVYSNGEKRVSFVSKWLPKETGGFSWVFDLLSEGWDPHNGHKGYAKKKYRWLVSTIKRLGVGMGVGLYGVDNRIAYSNDNDHYYDGFFIGDYVRGILFDESVFGWVNHWDRLVRSFSRIYNSIPIIQLCGGITDEQLFHMIGYACLLMFVTKTYRVLLISSVPIWLDLSEWESIDGMVRHLWCYCKDARLRSNWVDAIGLLQGGLSMSSCISTMPIQLFFFGTSFPMDLLESFRSSYSYDKVSIVLWNMSSEYMMLDMKYNGGFIYMSGRSTALVRHFYKSVVPLDSFHWDISCLSHVRFDRMKDYFYSVSSFPLDVSSCMNL